MKSNTFKFLMLVGFLAVLSFKNIIAQTVYVTENGKKYHAKNCALAPSGKKGLELKDAKSKGYTPCAKCKSDNIKADARKPQAAEKPKSAKPKK